MADGIEVVYGILSVHAGLTALVPAASMFSDDALPHSNGGPPALLISMISGTDEQDLSLRGASIHVRQRIRIEIYTKDAASRAAIRDQVREALRNAQFPTVSGISNVVVRTDSEGPDGLALDSDMRVGIQDVFVTYNEAR